jgi:hypothetical protein
MTPLPNIQVAEIACGLTRQLITIALTGATFVAWLSAVRPVSSLMLLLTAGSFGISIVLGLAFLMRSVNMLSVQKSYDVYAFSLRFLSAFQMILVLIGTALLVPILNVGLEIR